MRLFGYGNVYISIISSGQEYIIDTFGREMEDHSVKTISDVLIISEQHVIVDLTEESSQSYFVREANLIHSKDRGIDRLTIHLTNAEEKIEEFKRDHPEAMEQNPKMTENRRSNRNK